MCTRDLGADVVGGGRCVELAVMGAEAAVEILDKRQIGAAAAPSAVRREKIAEFRERFSGPAEALGKSFAQAAMAPAETRARLIGALAVLETKRVERPRKKHDVMPV